MRVVTVSITAAGAELAALLPYEHRRGSVLEAVAAEWSAADALIVIGAAGIAVRAVAPHLAGKRLDPAVLCVDDAGRHVVVLCGGHQAGGNDLAREVAGLLGAVPVISTATDGAGLPALDAIPGLAADGDVAGVTRRWLDGAAPNLHFDQGLTGWPLPPALAGAGSADGGRVTLTDRDRGPAPGEVVLRPRSLVVGVGSSRGASVDGLAGAVKAALTRAGCHPGSVARVATADVKLDEPAVQAVAAELGVPLVSFPAPVLAARPVPHPSQVVADAVGTPSVAEAAALVGAGPESTLVVTKTVSETGDSTVAVARRPRPPGHLAVVGLGPGHPDRRTPEAAAAVRHAQVVIGYGPYVDQAVDLLGPAHQVIRSPIGSEAQRCRQALEMAASGWQVALVCSGDAGVYAMASLVCELAAETGAPEVTVVPGVTAALAGAAVLGAPLGHDHASVSLSDLLTPWEVIERRLRAVAEGDFVVSLYNPRSQRRTTQLERALALLAGHRRGTTPAAVLTDIGRPGQHVVRTTLAGLVPDQVGMLSLVVVGSSQTRWIGERMVTPRGYLG